MSYRPDAEMQAWASQHHLDPTTLSILTDQGFTSIGLLQNLTPDDVTESFQKTKLLSLAQCIALKTALKGLSGGGGFAGGSGMGMGGEGIGGGGAGGFAGGSGGSYGGGASVGFEHMTYNGSAGPYGMGAQASQSPFQHHYQGTGEEFRFLLLGKTGSGKSTTGNTILGARLFTVGMSFEAVTDQCELRRGQNLGRTIEIMDSPGLFDTRRSHEEISIDIVKAVACMHPGPHAILYVIPLGRYTEEEYAVYMRLKALFDDHLTRYLIVLFTGGDRLSPGQSVEDMLQRVPTGLRKVLQECNKRYVLFNNMSPNTASQVEQLFSLVNDMKRINRQPYACPKYKAVGQGLEEEVARRLAAVEEREVERTRYVKKLKEQTAEAEQAVIREREQFQKREEEREATMRKQEAEREEKMQQMLRTMQEQRLSLEQQKEEERKLREQMDREKREQWQAMQEEREREREEMRAREKKWEEMMAAQREEDRRRQEERDRNYMEMMKDVQRQIAKGSGGGGGFGGFISGLVKTVGDVVSVIPGIRSLFKK